MQDHTKSMKATWLSAFGSGERDNYTHKNNRSAGSEEMNTLVTSTMDNDFKMKKSQREMPTTTQNWNLSPIILSSIIWTLEGNKNWSESISTCSS